MSDLRVARLRASYRLPADHADERPRLDGILRDVLADGLEAALARAGVRPEEEVCIRHVHAPVRLRADQPDTALASAWSVAMAEAIREAIGAGGAGVVRYVTPTHALLDLVLGVARDCYDRAWAWRRLGIWSVGDAPTHERAAEEVVRALVGRGDAVVGVIAAASQAGALPSLVRRIPAAGWAALAGAAADAAGVPETWVAMAQGRERVTLSGRDRWPGPGAARHRESSDGEGGTAPDAAAHEPGLAGRVATRSRIARNAPREVELRIGAALTTLAALEVEPALVSAMRPERFAALVRYILPPSGPAAAPAAAARQERAGADDRGTDRRPARGPEVPSVPVEPAEPRPVDPPPDPAVPVRPADPVERPEEQPGEFPLHPPPDLPPAAASRWGGLLFLLHVAGELEIATSAAADPALRGRPLRWTLHRLALHLVPGLAEEDPAALAFAGLAPDRPPPSADEPPPDREESRRLRVFSERLARRFHERVIGIVPPSPEAAAALVARHARREGRVLATPAWLDIVLRLDEVDVEVRRAGLDLDPGWVPWLGTVVRFLYE